MALSSLTSLGLDTFSQTGQIGGNALKAYLHALYPEEFEYYLFSLELVNRSGELIESIIFPVMPNSISEQRQSLVNIKKTNNSIVSLTNRTFAPTTINVNGTFGRKLRLLFSNQDKTKENSGSAFSFSAGKKNKANGEIKTGYGVTKLLERIILRSQRDPNTLLFLYNMSLNNNYLVECTDMSFNQSTENNMLWNYQLGFKSLARAESVYPGGEQADKNKIKSLLKFSVINTATASLLRVASGVKSLANESAIKMGANPDNLTTTNFI